MELIVFNKSLLCGRSVSEESGMSNKLSESVLSTEFFEDDFAPGLYFLTVIELDVLTSRVTVKKKDSRMIYLNAHWEYL